MTTDTPTRDRSGTGWHEARARTRSDADKAAIRRADLWCQMQRIEKYLPELHRQREDAASHLRDLDELIADEQAALAEIRVSIT